MQTTLLGKLRGKKQHGHPGHTEGECACNAPPQESAVPGAFPLMMAGCGQPMQVQKVRGAADTAQFLKNLGFVEGSDVTVVCAGGGNLIVDVKGARVAVARQMAAKIMVKGRM